MSKMRPRRSFLLNPVRTRTGTRQGRISDVLLVAVSIVFGLHCPCPLERIVRTNLKFFFSLFFTLLLEFVSISVAPALANSLSAGGTYLAATRRQLNTDHCSSNPCQNGASCWPGNGTFTCWCLPGYAGQQCNLGPYIPIDGNAPNDLLAGNWSSFGFHYVQQLNSSDFSYAPGHSLER